MPFERLWAKSLPADWPKDRPNPDSIYLHKHLSNVHRATVQVLHLTGSTQLDAVGLEADEWGDRFSRVMILAAAVHDLGKANDHFQGMIQRTRERRDLRQGLRHEWCTLLMIEHTELREWFRGFVGENDVDWLALLCAVTGHHPGMHRDSPPNSVPGGAGTHIEFLMGHADFQCVVTWLTSELGLEPSPEIVSSPVDLSHALREVDAWHRKAFDEWYNAGDDEKRFIAICKACLLGCDVAGSALAKTENCDVEVEEWIQRALVSIPKREELKEVVDARLTDPMTGTLFELRPFQKAVAEEAAEITFVKAGCGTGKTLAAYNWTKERCPNRCLYFCYPTTGTATEGFRDYLFDAENHHAKHGAGLFHSRAGVDLELILDVAGDEDDHDTLIRVQSLDAWSTPIVSCTVDTVLGLIQNHRRGLYSWPALAQSAFIFDEIHAYDDALFSALLQFMRILRGIPVLLMTASMPEHRMRQLRTFTQRHKRELRVVEGPKDIEALPRYRFHSVIVDELPLQEIGNEIERGGKVLWVCNTVDRAMRAYSEAVNSGLQPLIYHSRFRYVDRVQRHRDVIEAFRNNAPALAICTQVAEMSLDISASLLITDLAPVPSLIQRLGRLNRRANPGDPTRTCVLVRPLGKQGKIYRFPYEESALEIAEKWFECLRDRDASQADLATAWEESAPRPEGRAPQKGSTWFVGGPATRVGDLRTPSPGITVVMEQDVPALRMGEEPLAKVLLPMSSPRGDAWKMWKRYRGIPIAPEGAVIYEPQLGAQWG